MVTISLFYYYDREKVNQASLPDKDDFYSNLNMEDITDADYDLAKRVCKDFDYHDLYVQSDTLL